MVSPESPASAPSVVIRPYQPEKDFPALVAFIAFQYEHEREFQRLARKHGGVVAPQYAVDLVRAVETHDGCLLIAEVGDSPVGFAAAYCLSDPDPVLEEGARRHGFVRDVFILPNWRRMKVALRLLHQTEAHFQGIGVSHLRIGGPARNKPMVTLCEKHGYEPHNLVFEKPVKASSYTVVDGKLVARPEGRR